MKIPSKLKKKLTKTNLRIIGLIAFALVGTILIFRTLASVPNQSIEAESATLTGGATKVSDNAASDGEYVAFGGTVTPIGGGEYALPPVDTTNAVRVTSDAELSQAISSASSGAVIVLNGSFGNITINGKNGGSNWITLIGDPNSGKVSTGRVYFDGASNIAVRNLDINATKAGTNYFGKAVQIKSSNYIRIWDNVIYNGEEAGISAPGDDGFGPAPSDHIDIRYNDIYNNSKNSIDCCQGSGISIFQPGINGSPDADGYSMRIIGNRIWDNAIGNISGDVTDGNGIILDNFFSRSYTNRTLIANNIVVNNGGVGIALTRSGHADVMNNTLYYNHSDRRSSVYNNGEILCNNFYGGDCTNNRIFNNIIIPRPDYGGDIFEPFAGGYVNGSKEVYFQNNIVTRPGWNAYNLGSLNLVVSDALLVNPQLDPRQGDWRPSSASPAVGAGLSSLQGASIPNIDASGKTRPSSPSIGAFEPN